MGEGRAPPFLERLAGLLCDPKELIPRMPLVSLPTLLSGRISGLEARPLVWGCGLLVALRQVSLRRSGLLIHGRGRLDPVQSIARTQRTTSANPGFGSPHQRCALQELEP